MLTVTTYTCKSCGDTVYSRTRHDFRRCSCGDVAIDGGFEYTRFIGDGVPGVLEIPYTKKELYDDWNKRCEGYGLIPGQKVEE